MQAVEEAPAFYQAILSVVVISVVPTLVLFCVPVSWLQKSVYGLNVQRSLLAFAAGGLLGDVFLHAIPHLLAHDHSHGDAHAADSHAHEHAHDGHEHEHAHEHAHEHDAHEHVHEHGDAKSLLSASTQVGLAVLAGFLVFFMIEKMLTSCMLASNCFVKHNHHHGHSHGVADGVDQDVYDADQSPTAKTSKSKRKKAAQNTATPVADDHKGAPASPRNGHSADGTGPVLLGSGGWLNLVADFMHNFTDGIAIGASFAGGTSLGMATTLSVFFHEIPHEIGDFTILLQNGFSKTKAIMAQFVTAVGALIGTLVGLMAYRNPTLEAMLLALTAGGFVYIATVTVLPELLASPMKGTNAVAQTLAEGLCFSAGVGLMVLVAIGEEHDH